MVRSKIYLMDISNKFKEYIKIHGILPYSADWDVLKAFMLFVAKNPRVLDLPRLKKKPRVTRANK